MSDTFCRCLCGWTGEKPRESVYNGHCWLFCPSCGAELETPWDREEPDGDAENDERADR